MTYKKTKCLLVSVPFIDFNLPLIGLPYLASFLKQNGYDVKICDLNIKMKSYVSQYDFDYQLVSLEESIRRTEQ